ncbi:cornifelin homolog [Haliotis rubra]|uniref:cornifelin homolog n=1 Tax=Haliotis rubra TaxID=36100 RepID=UPI001EE6011F|nr:cornifelin homolog [Haliotis rubra]
MSQGYPVTAQPYVHGHTTGHTTVVMTSTSQVKQTRDWSSGLFGCFDDIGTCLCGTFCSLCLECQVAMKMGEHCCVPVCVPGAIITMRTGMRERHHIHGGMLNDCCMSSFCGACVLCQLARELKHTGEWQLN